MGNSRRGTMSVTFKWLRGVIAPRRLLEENCDLRAGFLQLFQLACLRSKNFASFWPVNFILVSLALSQTKTNHEVRDSFHIWNIIENFELVWLVENLRQRCFGDPILFLKQIFFGNSKYRLVFDCMRCKLVIKIYDSYQKLLAVINQIIHFLKWILSGIVKLTSQAEFFTGRDIFRIGILRWKKKCYIFFLIRID